MKSACTALCIAAGLSFTTLPVRAAEFVNILTGGTSGVYYPLGVAVGKVVGTAMPDVKTSVQATKASVENLNLLQAGRGEIAFTLGDSLSMAWAGNEDAGFKRKLDKLRTIGAIYPNYIQIVARADSGIRTLADLKGKRVSVGAPKSGTELNARAILGAAGLGYGDMAKTEYLPFAESVELMKNRQLDATLQSAGLGVASIKDLAVGTSIVVVEVPPAVVAKMGDPVYVSATIPGGTYPGQDAPVRTVAVVNYLVSHADVPEATAYGMAKAVFENLGELAAAHSAARQIALDKATAPASVPMHPGAERYFREKGLVK
ncbi:TAXI family TRAP transporter solute-binding subunit [Azospirillum sp. RWY-5-1]|uniref:TAXI family TRAP transporter solute-binding subunit n=1 Tax=Azospirillum oleiclasticum TaxID=2735135 RepID=A0ABX2T9V9_9PROT|nr:TAXI family TRAP transporter solute-binding subunit [Azospirillum oleiclasticum]NYZ13844.1 TAXI family TRAP transporter solute-binding subunit [Azospirillum oleiclasticum]NYZ21116.1 TAXI family TRAP transporter solute-binding subunit [Azospirillum oleiclasticum]